MKKILLIISLLYFASQSNTFSSHPLEAVGSLDDMIGFKKPDAQVNQVLLEQSLKRYPGESNEKGVSMFGIVVPCGALALGGLALAADGVIDLHNHYFEPNSRQEHRWTQQLINDISKTLVGVSLTLPLGYILYCIATK